MFHYLSIKTGKCICFRQQANQITSSTGTTLFTTCPRVRNKTGAAWQHDVDVLCHGGTYWDSVQNIHPAKPQQILHILRLTTDGKHFLTGMSWYREGAYSSWHGTDSSFITVDMTTGRQSCNNTPTLLCYYVTASLLLNSFTFPFIIFIGQLWISVSRLFYRTYTLDTTYNRVGYDAIIEFLLCGFCIYFNYLTIKYLEIATMVCFHLQCYLWNK